ncbi:MAG TPA: phosphoglycolate phosphatase [Caulobacteraceae bacterium]|nr:phosphoglycolate phosphatase [Caulobacteraceae bacterium]
MPAASQALAGATVVFDLDGTLIDTAPDLIGTLNLVLAEQNLPALEFASARNLIGAGARALIARGFAAAGEPLDEARMGPLFARFIDLYLGRIADESAPFPGMVEALDALEAAGARLAVCTNKRTGLSVALMDALGLTHRFAAIVGADDAPAPKPDPSHLTTAIARAGGDSARAVMIGDSISDAGAARAAGVPLVLVSFGYTDIPVAQLGADVLIDHYDQLQAACEALLSPLSAPA